MGSAASAPRGRCRHRTPEGLCRGVTTVRNGVGVRTLGDLGAEAGIAVRAVGQSIQLVRWIHHEVVDRPIAKEDGSPVTIADFAVQAVVASHLTRHFAADALVAEEDVTLLRSAAGGTLLPRVADCVRHIERDVRVQQVLDWIDRGGGTCGKRFWALDPIDGTKGLLRGGQYAVALALIADGQVQLGVLGCPQLSLAGLAEPNASANHSGPGGIAVAVRGCGAWWLSAGSEDLTRLSVSDMTDPTHARVLRSFEAQHGDVARFERVLRALHAGVPPVLMDSQAKHALLAAGGADLLLRVPVSTDSHDHIWDQAAGSLLVEEAGGKVSDLGGRPLDFTAGRRLIHNEGLVASNDRLHEAALEAVQVTTRA